MGWRSFTMEFKHEAVKLVGVRAWIPPGERRTAADIFKLRLRAPDGHFFPVGRVATLETVAGQPQINRDDLKRMLAVTGRITGRDLGSTMRDVQAVLARPGMLPRGVYFELGGNYAEQQKAFAGLIAVFAGAVALVFLLLALSAVTIGLWITHTELNISSMMGMTMIVGIDPREALIQAGINRMRPIAMTTVAAILALLPLALGIGAGSAMQQPLAIAIISGLFLQLPLVLLALPVLLSLHSHSGTAIDD